jgi:hypothetical protein
MRSCSRTATWKIRPTWCENGRRVRESVLARRRSRSEYGGARASHQRLSRHVPLAFRRADALGRRRVQLDVGAGRHRDRAHAGAQPLSAGSSLEGRPLLRGGVVGPRAKIRGSAQAGPRALVHVGSGTRSSASGTDRCGQRALGLAVSGFRNVDGPSHVSASPPPRPVPPVAASATSAAPPAARRNDSASLAGLASAAGGGRSGARALPPARHTDEDSGARWWARFARGSGGGHRPRAITPRPAVNLVIYHGVLAPRARWCAAVVPAAASGDTGRAPERPPGPGRLSWATLLRRVFANRMARMCSRILAARQRGGVSHATGPSYRPGFVYSSTIELA